MTDLGPAAPEQVRPASPVPTDWASPGPRQPLRTAPRVVIALGLILGGLILAVVLYVAALIGMSVAYSRLPPIDTHLTAVANVEGRTVDVSGTANMPDGAVIGYSVYNLEDSMPSVDGLATVQDGRFSFAADVSSLPAGPAAVGFTVEVGPTTQPWNVVLTYGPGGERLAGDQVWTDSGDTFLEYEVEINIDETAAQWMKARNRG